MAVYWDYAQITCGGGREINEDSVIFVPGAAGFLVVVADGLGGHGHGEVASALLTEVFSKEFEAFHEQDPATFLALAFDKAQEEILKLQEERKMPDDMKTTAVAFVVLGDTACFAHCGDSRLYYFKKNKFLSRTLDHSVPQMLVLAKEIKEKRIAHHPDRNKLLRVVGIPWDSPRYELGEPFHIEGDSAFLLCTDGFWEYIDKKEMVKKLKKTSSAEEWLALMKNEVEKSADAAKMDNYTAAVIRGIQH